MTSLTRLYLSNNRLTGSIAAELGEMTQLNVLTLQNNQLSGLIPAELGGLTQLTHLYLGGNDLTGSIPVEFGRLTQLALLNLNGTQVHGCVPAGLRRLGSELKAPSLPFCAVTLSVSPASVAEAAGSAVVTVMAAWADRTHTRAGATAIPVAVSGVTASAGSDYDEVSDFDLIIGDGAASGTAAFTLTTIADALVEGPETVRITGADTTVATYTAATLTIADND